MGHFEVKSTKTSYQEALGSGKLSRPVLPSPLEQSRNGRPGAKQVGGGFKPFIF